MGISGTLRTSTAPAPPEVADGALIERVRHGDRTAYGVLYERHAPGARRFARSLGANDADADDVVAEVFAAVLSALERGKGPAGSFAPYLMSSIRHECYRTSRRGARESTDRFGPVDADETRVQHDPYDGLDEAAVVRVAFESLPDHLREVLWRTEVDELSPTELADGDGGSPHAVAMMALRARRALGSAYLNQHLVAERQQREISSECRDARPHLANYVRGALSERRRRRVRQHLDECSACEEARQGLGRMNRHLKAVPLLPLHLGSLASGSVGVKAQIVAWLSAEALPITTAGMMAVAVLSPMSSGPQESVAHVAPPATTSTPVPAAGGAPTSGWAKESGAAGVEVPSDGGRATALTGPFARWIADPPTATSVLEGAVPTTPATPLPAPTEVGVPAGPAAELARGAASGGVGGTAERGLPSGVPGPGPEAGGQDLGAVSGPPPGRAPDGGPGNPVPGVPPVQLPVQAGRGGAVPGEGPSSGNPNPGLPAGQPANRGNGNPNAGSPAHVPGNGGGNPGPPAHVPSAGSGGSNAGPPAQVPSSGNGNPGPPAHAPSAGTGGPNAGPPAHASNNGNGDPNPGPPAHASNNGNPNAGGPPPAAGTGNGGAPGPGATDRNGPGRAGSGDAAPPAPATPG